MLHAAATLAADATRVLWRVLILAGLLLASVGRPAEAQGNGNGNGSGGGGITPMAQGNQQWAIRVTPKWYTVYRASSTTDHVDMFSVTNTGTSTAEFEVSCSRSGRVLNCGLDEPGFVLAAGKSRTVYVTYDVGTLPSGSLTLTGVNLMGEDVDDDGTMDVLPPQDNGIVVSITPSTAPDRYPSSGPFTAIFAVENTSSSSKSITLGCSSTGPVNCGQVSPTSESVPAYSTRMVDVEYSTAGWTGTGSIVLTAAVGAGTPPTSEGVQAIPVIPLILPGPPAATIKAGSPSGVIERSQCLTAAVGAGVAIECGDLRVVHALPTLRTYATSRTPVLLYNSGHARPHPVVMADVGLPSGVAVPDSVELVLRVNGTERARRRWAGSFWAVNSARRVAIGYDATSAAEGTGFHPFTLEVATIYGAARHAVVRSGDLSVVKRTASPFGVGWWLAGLERLDIGSMVWVGGDGSLRQYQPAGTNRWAAPGVSWPDTIKLAGGEYTRYLPHGLRVTFDAQGRHIRTTNRLGHVTTFSYDASGRLATIEAPVPSGASSRKFVFSYANGALASVVAQAGSALRTTTFLASNGWITRITEPIGSFVQFTKEAGASGRLAAQTDARGTVVSFSYDSVSRFASATTSMGAGQASVTTSFRSLQSRGAGSVAPYAPLDTSRAYAALNGPRTDVGDSTLFWLSPLGAPSRIRDALGGETLVSYGDPRWPGLATRLQFPDGRVTGAVYDDRGNLDALADSSRVINGQVATRTFDWDAKWDFAISAVQPLGDRVDMAYDPVNGNRLWQQDGRGASSRVVFRYAEEGQLEATDPPLTPPDSIAYDDLGNVMGVRSPRGFWTWSWKDAFGRDTLLTTPLDSVNAQVRREHTTYDLAGRPLETWTAADGAGAWFAAESILVSRTYDAGGLPLSLARLAVPDTAHIGIATTNWRYDALGRRVAEVAPDGAVDSVRYDPAGNIVERLTRRGHVITLEYDALSRLIRRTTPAVVYADTSASGFTFPEYPNWQGTDYRVSGDTATFTYDQAGRLLWADNRNARIRRTYATDGSLTSDSLWTRTWAELSAGGNFTTHVYGLRHGYDLNGRRIWTKVPLPLAARYSTFWSTAHDSMAFGYSAQHGALTSARDVLGNVFTFEYDLNQRVDRVNYPEGHFKEYTFDPDGLTATITQNRLTTGGSPGINTITLERDPQGRMTAVEPLTNQEDLRRTYLQSGLGPLRSAQEPMPGSYEPGSNNQWYRVDPLGNRVANGATSSSWYYAGGHSEPWNPVTATSTTYAYSPGIGRLLSSVSTSSYTLNHPSGVLADPTWRRGGGQTAYRHDAAGNEYWRATLAVDTVCLGCSANGFVYVANTVVASYYDAEDRLVGTDSRYSETGGDIVANPVKGFEESRYDALGRRILRRNRHESLQGVIQRYVWDGNNLAAETRYPGGPSESATALERDTTTLIGPRRFWGRVLYLPGEEVDQPLSVVRIGFGDSIGGVFRKWEPLTIAPWWNASGSVWADEAYGVTADCQTVGGATRCITQGQWPATTSFRGQPIPSGDGYYPTGMSRWHGSLVEDQKDASGKLFRRNRFYDPVTGRFTQEDPIGLAGGLNAYGFGHGDPVNFGDPFGLCPPESEWTPECDKPLESAGLMDPTLWLSGGLGGGLRWLGARLFARRAARAAAGAALAAAEQTASRLAASSAARHIADATGGIVTDLAKSEGFRVTISGARNVVVRIKDGGAYRVSIEGLGSLTREGLISGDRALTHLMGSSKDEMLALVRKALEQVAAPH